MPINTSIARIIPGAPIIAGLLLIASPLLSQPVQTIRGTVVDEATRRPVIAATVLLKKTSPAIGARTDANGEFTLKSVPVGRYELQVSSVGYEPAIVNELLVTSGKEVVLTITLRETSHELGEVVVRPRYSKALATNTMAAVSSRMFSVEEANRYAGGFDDPARLASAFAGVASSLGNNGIAVRGNSPASLQWRIEGIEIPNPNHFADLQSFGGGGLTALSGQTLTNSDFFTGAFPAEYTNALSGVFDINIRRGNPRRHEHVVGLGAIGIDLASEGPIGEGTRSSYLFNYRYSTLSLLAPLLPEDAGGTSYQDLTFKVALPAGDAGAVTLWGIGLVDRSGTTPEPDTARRSFRQDRMDQDVRQFMGAGGITHSAAIGEAASIKTTLAATGSGLDLTTSEADPRNILAASESITSRSINVILSSAIETAVADGHLNRTGATITMLGYDMDLLHAPAPGDPLLSVVDERGRSFLVAAHTGSSIRISPAVNATIGLASQYFSLNGRWTLEPRAGLRVALDESTLSLGYGLHSRLERLGTYFVRRGPADAPSWPNRSLDFAKAHHLVLGYDRSLGESMRLKIEPYWQYLFDQPVVPGTSRSLANAGSDWFADDSLANTGLGRNIGVDVTIERFLEDGYYFLVSGSVFQSRYMGGDGVWRRTRYDRGYAVNLLAGREWGLGEGDRNVLSLSGRLTLQGGDRITPYDAEASRAAGEVVLDERRAFEEALPAMLLAHVSAGWRINGETSSWLISLNVINATAAREPRGWRYNERTGAVELEEDMLVVPNLGVKWEF